MPNEVILLAITLISAPLLCAQCSANIYLTPGTNRDSGNDMQGLAYVAADIGSGTWNASLTASLYFQPTSGSPVLVTSGSASGQIVSSDLTSPSNPNWIGHTPGGLNSNGAGSYYVTMSASVTDSCGDRYSLGPQTSPAHPVSRPTISVSSAGTSSSAFWNLGPGTADPITSTFGGTTYGAYNQHLSLSISVNCSSGDTCNDTPQWSIATSDNQAVLSATSGSSTTLNKGSSPGNCEYDTNVSVNIGGFYSATDSFAANSPVELVSQAGYNTTQSILNGYSSFVFWAVADACSPANAITSLPLYETFSGLANSANVNWPNPTATSSGGFDYDPYRFWDQIAVASDGTYSPVPLYTSSGPTFTYYTVLKQGSQTWTVGATSSPNGTQVFSGTITYYQDHGTSQ